MSCDKKAEKIDFFRRKDPISAADCSGRGASAAYKPSATIQTAQSRIEGAEFLCTGQVLSIVVDPSRENTPLSSGEKKMIAMVSNSDRALNRPLGNIYAKWAVLDQVKGGLIETAEKFGDCWRVEINPSNKIPEVIS